MISTNYTNREKRSMLNCHAVAQLVVIKAQRSLCVMMQCTVQTGILKMKGAKAGGFALSAAALGVFEA